MVDDYQQEYVKFLAEIQKIDDTADAKFEYQSALASQVVSDDGQTNCGQGSCNMNRLN